jgi:hypothetical protein
MDFDTLVDDSQATPQNVQPQPGPGPSFDNLVDDSEKPQDIGESIKAGAEGVAQGLLGPLAPLAEERYLGVKPEAMRAREEAHPYIHGAGEVAGLLSPIGEGALLGEAGKAIKGLTGVGKESGLIAKVGAAAASQAAEMALFQSGDEVSRMIKEDPNASAQAAISNIGMASLLGAGIGGAFGAVSPLWKATIGDKLAQGIEDFRGRAKFRLDNPDLREAFGKELGEYYTNINNVADDVYGPKGLKAQEIEKLMPEAHEGMVKQTAEIGSKLDNALKSLQDTEDPHVKLLQREVTNFKDAVSKESASPSAIFDATQKLKQQLQEWGKFNKDIVPLSEKNFRTTAKNLAYDVRTSLENPEVWGKAGERQQSINKAFSEFLPALKDFNSKFTTKVGGDRVLDPGKINTYMNQLGKPNAEIKQEMLKNFIQAAEKYSDTLSKTHANLGLEHPMDRSSLSIIKDTLGKPSPGAALADKLIDHGLSQVAGKTAGGVAGGIAGAHVGHGYFGFLLGEHLLGPMFSSVLPGITKPLLDSPGSIEGFKSALDYGAALAKGEKSMNQSAKNVFKAGAQVISASALPDEADRKRLDKAVTNAEKNPQALLDSTGHVGHYLPQHEMAISETKARAAQYLQSIKPRDHQPGPLDKPVKPSSMDEIRYHRALDIAQNPLVVMQHIKDGTLQISDCQDLKSLYPDYYTRIAQKLSNEMISKRSDNEEIPYRTKMCLSIFLGQALDSSMIPTSIQAAQPAPKQPNTVQQQPKKGSPSKLGTKTTNMYKTPNQAAETDKTSRE